MWSGDFLLNMNFINTDVNNYDIILNIYLKKKYNNTTSYKLYNNNYFIGLK